MHIQKATHSHLNTLTALVLALWPEHTEQEMAQELEQLLSHEEAACFLAFDGEYAAGFAQCQLRHDYVEGTQTSPVGYLEGIYVSPERRGQGIAGKLLAACQGWAKEKGCREFASDCELTNTDSLAFHLAMGFTEANRVICFTKKL